ncbi:MAG: phosphoribosylanthranilate isomerase [Bacteroidota bacterium]
MGKGLPGRVRVKICCISTVAEAKLAIEAGADALGLVSAMPSGPGVVEEHVIKEIARVVAPPVATFLLTSETTAASIVAQQQFCATNVLQLVDHVLPEEQEKLRLQLPGIGIVQVVHVVDEDAVTQAVAYASHVDALLLDSGNPDLSVKELGGTGRTHNWDISREIVKRVSIPVFLAGGLNPQNVVGALRVVQPYGVDICSGVRSGGQLDQHKLAAFFEAIRSV